MQSSGNEAGRKSPRWIAWAVDLFAPVKRGEWLVLLLLSANVFLILCGYYLLKTAREGLILGGGGMLGLRGDELKIYASGAMAILLIGVIPAYGALASRVRRIRLITYSYVAVMASLAIFFVLGRAGVPVGLAFFLWLGIVNVFLVGQFWSYANDIYTEEQGKRLFALIAIGASAGAIFGPRVAKLGDTFTVMLVAAGLLAVCLGLFYVVEMLSAKARRDRPVAAGAVTGEPLGKEGGFQLVLRDRYLTLIALLLIIANLVNTTGEFLLSNAITTHAHSLVPDGAHLEIANAVAREAAIDADRTEIIKAFYADFYYWVNLIGFIVQATLVARLLSIAGVRVALFVLPVIALAGYGTAGLVGGLAIIRVAKIAENSTDYSLQNTVRQALFLPTSREAKYKAKAAIDTFFVRIGDTVAALMVAVGIHRLGLGPTELAFANAGLVLVWLLIAAGVARGHRRLTARLEEEAAAVPAPRAATVEVSGTDILESAAVGAAPAKGRGLSPAPAGSTRGR